MDGDWRDGFLFVGNSLALDFLNTRPVIAGEEVEMLPDAGALAAWLSAAGLIGRAEAARLKRKWTAPESAAAVAKIREFRERLRETVLQIEAGSAPSAAFVKRLNDLLLRHPCIDQVVGGERRRRFVPATPEDAFAPLADAVAALLTGADQSRIRKCPTCVLHFQDTSKKGNRIWCSMSLCGNRAKVAAFARRKRVRTG